MIDAQVLDRSSGSEVALPETTEWQAPSYSGRMVFGVKTSVRHGDIVDKWHMSLWCHVTLDRLSLVFPLGLWLVGRYDGRQNDPVFV